MSTGGGTSNACEPARARGSVAALAMLAIATGFAGPLSSAEDRRVEPGERAELGKQSQCAVRLPDSVSVEISSPPPVVLRVRLDGSIEVAGKQLPDDQIDNLFRATFAHDRQTKVVFEADRGVEHARVVTLVERAKAAGLTRLAVGTAAPET